MWHVAYETFLLTSLTSSPWPSTSQCVFNAHDSPLQCLEYCEERDELATCGMGNKVKIWNVKKPAQVRLLGAHALHAALPV